MLRVCDRKDGHILLGDDSGQAFVDQLADA
jgi:hypothetical protein